MDLQLEYFKEGFDIVALTKFFGIREDMPLPDFYTRFEDLQERLEDLHSEMGARSQVLKKQSALDERKHLLELETLEAILSDIKSLFAGLDNRMGTLAHTVARIGDRLQTVHAERQRGLDALEILHYLVDEFSVAGGGEQGFQGLSDLFLDPGRAVEAADIVQRLMTLGREILSAKERVGVNAQAMAGGSMLDRAVRRLQEYAASLESRTLLKWDDACLAGDLDEMAECAAVMHAFKRMNVLVQRYISSRGLFATSADQYVRTLAESSAAAPGTPSGLPPNSTVGKEMKIIMSLFREVIELVEAEVELIQEVFPEPGKVGETLYQRLLDEKIRPVLHNVLKPFNYLGSAQEMQQYARLLVHAYQRTQDLTQELATLVPTFPVTPDEIVVRSFEDMLVGHLELENRVLQGLFEDATNEYHGNPAALFTVQDCSRIIERNKEAIERIVILSQPSQRPQHVRHLFHSSTANRANMGCMLEQTAVIVIAGLNSAAEVLAPMSEVPGKKGGKKPEEDENVLIWANLASMTPLARARDIVDRAVTKVFEAARNAQEIAAALQKHYLTVVNPALHPNMTEVNACQYGYSCLIRAVEEKALVTLNGALKYFIWIADKTLNLEQKKDDFRPKPEKPVDLDRPTPTCLLICALVSALFTAAQTQLRYSNLWALLAEAGLQLVDRLDGHMQKFVYNPTGALQAKRDFSEYQSALRVLRHAEVDEAVAKISDKINLLMVPADSLVYLVETELKLTKAVAWRYIKLREDAYKARVNGKKLADLFSANE